MKVTTKRFLAACLMVLATGISHAAIITTDRVTISYTSNWLTPTVHDDNAVTFNYPDTAVYEAYSSPLWIDKRVLEFNVLPGYKLTGKMHLLVNATVLGNNPDISLAGVGAGFDVLEPWCKQCGMFDATIISTARTGSRTEQGNVIEFSTETSSAAGLYDRLLMYFIIDGSLQQFDTRLKFNSVTITAEAVPTSTVPELPAAALMLAGLTLLAARRTRHSANVS